MNIATMLESPAKRRGRWQQEALDIWRFKLSLWQKLRLRLGGRIYVRHERLAPDNPGNRETALYLFYCRYHDVVDIDYDHGYDRRLDCNLCDLSHPGEAAPNPVLPPTQPAAA